MHIYATRLIRYQFLVERCLLIDPSNIIIMSNVFEISDREIKDLSAENEKLKQHIELLETRLLKETKNLKVARDAASTIKHFKSTG